MSLEIKEYGDKAFLSPNNNFSSATYSARVKPEENLWRFRVHDCNTGICLHGKLEKEEDFVYAVERLNNLSSGIFNLVNHFNNERIRLFHTDEEGNVNTPIDMMPKHRQESNIPSLF